MDEISGKDFDLQVSIINEITEALYGIEESIILVLFDVLSPDYKKIKRLLEATNIIDDYFFNETILKLKFEKQNISEFLKVFFPKEKDLLILYYGGYVNKPYNCTNYLNEYYLDSKTQLINLSNSLSEKTNADSMITRMNNMIYSCALYTLDDERTMEYFYFSLWCSSAPHRVIRQLATKLLYDITCKKHEYITILISLYGEIHDFFIRDAIINVLSHLRTDDKIQGFFRNLLVNDPELFAKDIKRISDYLKEGYRYINWKRTDLYKISKDPIISDTLARHLHMMDLLEKDHLPIRYWDKEHIEIYPLFIVDNKSEITALNKNLELYFSCVKGGTCCGRSKIEQFVHDHFSSKIRFEKINPTQFLASYEMILMFVFAEYGLDYYEEQKGTNYGYHNTLYLKCFDVATELFYGSLMCNYYTDIFSSYNNRMDNIGYEVYDPLEYGEDIFLSTPIAVYNNLTERLNHKIMKLVSLHDCPSEQWVRNATLTRNNILSIIKPFVNNKKEWILLAGRISLNEYTGYKLEWRDTYNIWCCTSEDIHLDKNNARSLTIELEEYTGMLDVYKTELHDPHKCKKINSILSVSDYIDETSLVLPPADLIRFLNLSCTSKCNWVNENEEVIIVCNNNKSSYYHDSISSSVFIRKDYLDLYLQNHSLKYFAFTERMLSSTGFVDETSLHFEIENAQIVEEITNADVNNHRETDTSSNCSNCYLNDQYNNSNSSTYTNENLIDELLRK